MHLELVVPGLQAAAADIRYPAIELLIARGRCSRGDALSGERWLARAFGLADASLPAGALTLLASGGDPGNDFWLRADPVHLRLGRDAMTLVPSAGFSISADEASALAATLNRHFAGVFVIQVVDPAHWCLKVTGEAALQAGSPLDLAGQDVNANLPTGADAARWHATLNEVQMLLHDHPVNASREIALNSLWFWGAGRLPGKAQGPWQSVSAADPVALGLARLAGIRSRALPESLGPWLERLPEDGRHLVVLDSLPVALALGGEAEFAAQLELLEERWFAPILAALRSNRIGMVSAHIPEASVAFETVRGDLGKFWRRPRPLAVLLR